MIRNVALALCLIPGFVQDKPGPKAKAPYRIYFISDREGRVNQVFSMDPDGGKVRQVTEDEAYKLDPAVSPDGKRIAYVARKGKAWELFTADADGENPRQLTETGEGENYSPFWHPDGRRILFYASGGKGEPAAIVAGDPSQDPFKPEKVKLEVPEKFGASGGFPAVSPDGKRVAFVSGTSARDDSTWEIFVADEKGKTTRLTNDATFDSGPVWSPDGKKIAFVSNRDGNDEIYVMDPDGKNVERLTEDPQMDSRPLWTPDGKKIVFVSARDGNAELYAMDPDGSDPKNLTNHDAKDSSPRCGLMKKK